MRVDLSDKPEVEGVDVTCDDKGPVLTAGSDVELPVDVLDVVSPEEGAM